MKKGQKVKYTYYDKIKVGTIEWIEPKDIKMPYRKMKFTNGDVVTEASLI